MLNKQGENKIDWCDYSVNFIQAECLHKCPYCYVTRMNKRFNVVPKEPMLREDYFKCLNSKKLKVGDKIFVGSSTDMFGEWIKSEWIKKIIDLCKQYQNLIFLFLTKNPKRYAEFEFSKNCLLGYTIDTQKRYEQYIDDTKNLRFPNNNYFISFEPLLENIKLKDLKYSNVKWFIIGANSNIGEPKPPDEWCDNLIKIARKLNILVWVKNNYKYHSIIKEQGCSCL